MPPRLVNTHCCYRTRQCINHTKPPNFSTSSALHAQIPPESPNFIEVPRLLQPRQPFPIRIKGFLPPPKRIFPRPKKGQLPKSSPAYLAAVTREPLVDKTTYKDDDFVSWKARQSALRRKNLREGITELRQKKHDADKSQSLRAKANYRIREALLYAPEPEDVRLTTPSVLSTQRPMKHQRLPDPARAARVEAKRQNVADMAAMREENRRHALHKLYVHAGDFITTEEQLERVVERAFEDRTQFRNDNAEGVNIWNLGFPETVQQLLGKTDRRGRQSALDSAEGNQVLTRERMKKIGEELTGGKMLEER
ncbi:hypothetical protein BDR22DRAFT_855377 [Usnea florida]